MSLNMKNVSRTAEVIEWPSVPRENPRKSRFGRLDMACVLWLLVGFVFFTTTDASATDYYVSSSSGSDFNPGTLAAPWRTLAKVTPSSSFFKPGDRILLKRGDTWNEQFNIVNQLGVSGTPVTYGAYGSGALPTVDAQQTRPHGIYMNNVAHVVVRDIRTINATSNGFHIVAGSGNVSDVVVQGVVSERNAGSGFSVEATPGVTDVDALIYRDAVAHLNGDAGFLAYNVSEGATGVHYYNCQATYNGQTTASHGFSAYFANNLHLHGVEAAFTNIDPATGQRNATSTGGEGIGIAFDNHVDNSSVEHSYSHDNAGVGLALGHESANNVASYNVIARNGSIGLVVNGWSSGSTNMAILNNTIYGNKNYGIVAWNPTSGLTIKNNIVVNNIGYAIQFSSTGVTNYTVANNLLFGNTLGTTSNVSGATGTIVADPLFTAPASGDFSLQASSPAINAGLNLGSLYQLGLMKGSIWTSGVLLLDQGAAWDIGAFVYGPMQSTTLLASSANPSVVGANVTFTATVTGSAPTGSVAFTADGTTLSGCSAVALPTGTANSKTATCSTASLSAGVHSVVGSYAGDAANNSSSSAALSQVVGSKTASTTSLTSSSNPAALGANVTFTATVTGNAPTGSVAFTADGTTLSGCSAVALPTGTANSKTATCSTASLSAATHSIVATYGGDAANTSSSTAALSQVVNTKTASTTSLASSANPSAVGANVTFTATVTGSAPTGSVAFRANGTTLSGCSAVALPTGTANSKTATCSTASLSAGTHSIVATYGGDAGNNGSGSAALSQVVKTASTTSLASSANPSAVGANVTFTATVTGSAPTGTVAFTADGTTLSGCSAVALPTGTFNSKIARCSTASLSAGTHSIVATYGGDAGNNGSTSVALSQVVNTKTASTTGLASSANPSAVGANVTFTATVTGSAPTGSVAFTADGTTLSGCSAVVLPTGTANSKIATCSTASLSAGTHSIVATYGGDAGNNGSSSAALSQVVGSKTASTTSLASSANPSAVGANVTFTATVTGSAPTGSVAFTANGTTLSGCSAVALPTGTANSKTAACSTASLSAGTHSIVATYGGDAGNNGSSSAALSQVVGSKTATTTGLASSANPSAVGANVTFTATVTGSAPTGSVAFTANGTTLSGCSAVALPTGTANSKTAACSTASLSAGTHSIVATYGGDAGNNGSGSAALSQVVGSKTASTTGLASSANPSAVGANVTFTATVTGSAPTGSVAFRANGTTLSGCSAVALPTGTANSKTATCSTANLSAGTHSIVGTYTGDAANNGSSSAALSQQVVSAALVNPSFEIPVLPSGGYQSNPTATGIGWTFSGKSGIQRNGSTWGAAPAPAGTQTAFIQMTGTISQTLNLNAGIHTLSFQAARRSCCASPYVQPVKVTIDGIQIGSLVSPASTSFTAFSIQFSVTTSGAHTLTFSGTDPGNKTTFIDAVTLQ